MKNNFYEFEHLGKVFETAVTPTTCPPGTHGIGGDMICSWYRIKGGRWHSVDVDIEDEILKMNGTQLSFFISTL
jgi:hypothetical protein